MACQKRVIFEAESSCVYLPLIFGPLRVLFNLAQVRFVVFVRGG
jgi:hypothetical protein